MQIYWVQCQSSTSELYNNIYVYFLVQITNDLKKDKPLLQKTLQSWIVKRG